MVSAGARSSRQLNAFNSTFRSFAACSAFFFALADPLAADFAAVAFAFGFGFAAATPEALDSNPTSQSKAHCLGRRAAKPIARNRSRDFLPSFSRTKPPIENEERVLFRSWNQQWIYGSDLHSPPPAHLHRIWRGRS